MRNAKDIRFRVWDGTQYYEASVSDLVQGYPLSETKCFSDDLKFEQSTGLHDRNGKEIWEGDIIQEKWSAPCGQIEDSYVVKFGLHENGEGFLEIGFYADHTLHGETREKESGSNLYPQKENRRRVIGNIHQYPHLLVHD